MIDMCVFLISTILEYHCGASLHSSNMGNSSGLFLIVCVLRAEDARVWSGGSSAHRSRIWNLLFNESSAALAWIFIRSACLDGNGWSGLAVAS